MNLGWFFCFSTFWNIEVALINHYVLQAWYDPEVMIYVTPRSQLTPIVTSLLLWLYFSLKQKFPLHFERMRMWKREQDIHRS